MYKPTHGSIDRLSASRNCSAVMEPPSKFESTVPFDVLDSVTSTLHVSLFANVVPPSNCCRIDTVKGLVFDDVLRLIDRVITGVEFSTFWQFPSIVIFVFTLTGDQASWRDSR